MKLILVASYLLVAVQKVHAFSVIGTTKQEIKSRSTTSSTSPLFVIRGEDENTEPFDIGQGGVRLAEESAIKIFGDVKHKPGSADPQPMDLMRYTKITDVNEKAVQNAGAAIICTGRGVELYANPGETVDAVVTLAPLDAVRDALNSAGSTQQYDKIVINFLGGEEMQFLEVLEAVSQLTLMLDISTKAKVSFNSLSHRSIPPTTVTLTVVGLSGSESVGKSGLESGEIYFRDDGFCTVLAEDINPAIE